MKRLTVILFFLIALSSCDPMNTKFVFKNNDSSNKLICLFVGTSSNDLRCIKSYTPIPKQTRKGIGLFSKVDSYFESVNSESLIAVAVLNDSETLREFNGQIDNQKCDSIMAIGEYDIKFYSLKEIKLKNFEINFPADGFVKGKPIKMLY